MELISVANVVINLILALAIFLVWRELRRTFSTRSAVSELEYMVRMARIVVRSIEQLSWIDANMDKKLEAMARLRELSTDDDLIDSLVEAAVFDMKNEQPIQSSQE